MNVLEEHLNEHGTPDGYIVFPKQKEYYCSRVHRVNCQNVKSAFTKQEFNFTYYKTIEEVYEAVGKELYSKGKRQDDGEFWWCSRCCLDKYDEAMNNEPRESYLDKPTKKVRA